MPLIKDEYGARYEIPKVADNAAELLELCYQDIPIHWICGSWSESCELNGYKKPKGCAMGLIAMNAGLADFRVYPVEDYDQETDTLILSDERFVVAVHIFEDDIAEHPVAREATMCLVLAMKQEFIDAAPYPTDNWKEFFEDNPSKAQDMVIGYNDNQLLAPSDAAKWFADALAIARDRATRSAELQPTHS